MEDRKAKRAEKRAKQYEKRKASAVFHKSEQERKKRLRLLKNKKISKSEAIQGIEPEVPNVAVDINRHFLRIRPTRCNISDAETKPQTPNLSRRKATKSQKNQNTAAALSKIREVREENTSDDTCELLPALNTMSISPNIKTEENNKRLQNLKRTISYAGARENRLRRQIAKLNHIIEEKDREIHRWQSKYYRAIQKGKSPDSPLLTNVKAIEAQGKAAVRNRLLFCEVLEKNLMDSKQKANKNSEKSIFSQIISGKIIKKYK